MTRFVARRARRRVPAGRAGARDRRRDGPGQAPRAPRRRLGPLARARARQGGRDVHPHARRRARTSPVFELHARPLEDLRTDVRTLARSRARRRTPGASPARRPAGRGEARLRWLVAGVRAGGVAGVRAARRRPTSATRRTAARCSSGRSRCVQMTDLSRRPASDDDRRRDPAAPSTRPRAAWSQHRRPLHVPGHHVSSSSTDPTPRATNDGRNQRHLPHQQLVQADRDRASATRMFPTTRPRWR